MADTSAPVLQDESRLSRIDLAIFRLESRLNFIGGIVILLMVTLTVINVLGRWLFNLPISGYIDWIEQSMAFFAFLGLAYCQRLGAHIRMDIVIGNIHGRARWLAELASTFLMLGVTLVLIYGSALHAWRAFDIGDSSMDIGLPTWPAKLVVPLALIVLALRLLVQLWAYSRAVKASDKPVAVPMNQKEASDTEALIKEITDIQTK